MSGHGWVLVDQNIVLHLGLKSAQESLSPLHAEVDSLLWTLECMISIGVSDCSFATDCADLISLHEKPSEWPTFVAGMATFGFFVCFFLLLVLSSSLTFTMCGPIVLQKRHELVIVVSFPM